MISKRSFSPKHVPLRAAPPQSGLPGHDEEDDLSSLNDQEQLVGIDPRVLAPGQEVADDNEQTDIGAFVGLEEPATVEAEDDGAVQVDLTDFIAEPIVVGEEDEPAELGIDFAEGIQLSPPEVDDDGIDHDLAIGALSLPPIDGAPTPDGEEESPHIDTWQLKLGQDKPLPPASLEWQLRELSASDAAHLLVAERGLIWAGSKLGFDWASETIALPSSACGLCRVSQERALVTSLSGKAYWLELGGTRQQLVEVAEETPRLRQLLPSLTPKGNALGVRGDGQLMSWSLQGSWSPLPCPLRVERLAADAVGLWALGVYAGELALARLAHDEAIWRVTALPAGVALRRVSSHTQLAAAGNYLLLADPNAGVLLSSDGGQTFASTAGTLGVSAATLIEQRSAIAYAAVHHSIAGATEFIRIDVESGQALSLLQWRPEGPDTEEPNEVHLLAWGPATSTLYAAAEVGVYAVTEVTH